jgi:hypothetical protein
MNPMTVPTKWLPQVGTGAALLASLVAPACGAAPDRLDPMPWTAELQRMDEALGRGDLGAAARARQNAYRTALGSRRWEAMAAVGDASVRLARRPGAPAGMVPEARRAYLAALYRARHAHSADGVLQMADAFAALGDREAARQALVMAASMTAGTRATEIAERMRALRERLDSRAPASVGSGDGSSVARLAPVRSAD